MTQFTTLTEQTARDLIDLLRRDRAHPVGGPARVGNIGQQGQVPVRWGKTSTTPDYPTYPSSGNVVGVSLGNYEPSPLYPGATAVKTFTAYDPPIYVFATAEDDTLPAEGTEVRLTWRNGRWWITPEAGSGWPTCFLIGGQSFNSDGSNRNYLYGYHDGYESSNRVGYAFFDYSYGDTAGVGLSVVTNRTAVNATSSAETSPLFSLSTTGLYLIHLYVDSDDDTSIPAASTSNVTSGVNSAGSPSHTHEVTVSTDRQYGSRMAATLQYRLGAGAWTTLAARTNSVMFTRTGAASLYRRDAMSATFYVVNTTADREWRLRLNTDLYPSTLVYDSAHRAARIITSVDMTVSRVDDDPAYTTL
jgi:hypothetical protein